jgi:propanol-preferring alcohol dehydrogenase
VALDAVPGCGAKSCPECGRGIDVLCELCHHAGIGQDGYHAPYCAVSARAAVLVPHGVTPAQAAVACDAVKTGYHAIVKRGEVKKHETVFLFGLGGLGFNALQTIRHIGARVIVSERKAELLEEAVKIGVPREDIVPAGTSVTEFVQQNGLVGKIDTVLDFVGAAQTFADSQAIVRRGGKIVNVGTFDHTNVVDMKNGIRKRLTFLFSYGGFVEDLEEVLGLIEKGVIQPVVEERGASDFPDILEGLVKGTITGRMALQWE